MLLMESPLLHLESPLLQVMESLLLLPKDQAEDDRREGIIVLFLQLLRTLFFYLIFLPSLRFFRRPPKPENI